VHVYEVRPRKDNVAFDLISDAAALTLRLHYYCEDYYSLDLRFATDIHTGITTLL